MSCRRPADRSCSIARLQPLEDVFLVDHHPTGCLRCYVQFARSEPGLFRTAFSAVDLRDVTNPDRAGASGLTPFQLLGTVLDELVEVGVLPAERRPGAEFLAWSAVHGLAVLLTGSPLRGHEEAQTEEVLRRLLDMVDHGL